jgi:hypothetical protein
MMNDHGMICGPRRRSRVHVALNTAFTFFALAAFLFAVGVACQDLLQRPDWHLVFVRCAKLCAVIGVVRLVWLALLMMGFVAYHRLAARYPAVLKLRLFKDTDR